MKRFKNIVVSVDSRVDDHPALRWAALLAEHNGAQLKIVDVLPEFPWHVRLALRDAEHMTELLLLEKQQRLDALAGELRQKGLEVTARALRGQASVEITREVLRGGHDLVVRVTKGPHSRRSGFIGTTSFGLLRKCPCPVWIVKPEAEPRFAHVLGAIDPTVEDETHRQLNRDIIELTQSVAASENARYSILHVWSVYGEQLLAPRMRMEDFDDMEKAAQQSIEKALDQALARHRLNVRDENVHVVHGEPAYAIPQFVAEQNVDLLVMGTVGRSGISGLIMGNTAEMILGRVDCAVLALKPDAFVSPVRVAG